MLFRRQLHAACSRQQRTGIQLFHGDEWLPRVNQVRINNNHSCHLLRDYYVPDTCPNSFNLHNNPLREELLLSLLQRRGKWDSESLNDLCRVTQLESGRTGFKPGCPTPEPAWPWASVLSSGPELPTWVLGPLGLGPCRSFLYNVSCSQGIRVPPTPSPTPTTYLLTGFPFFTINVQFCSRSLIFNNLPAFANCLK